MKKFLALVLGAMMVLGCVASTAAAKEIGFEEFPIGEEQDVDVLHVAAVYFQPVDMEPMAEAGLSAEEADLHIEADISANENELGFGVGDWVPFLTVDYTIVGSDGKVAAEGTFMPMAASDGPHYGANIALPNADTYTLIFTIHSPEENGYLLHVDAETGVTGRFWTEPLTVTYEGWEYIPQEW
ncbi:MAG: iron transporter [Oscillospiraceae bacterium]|jgi:uncharacterized protein involved in high-affinity Fe2+ transport|nr:iron transporter [Oscillospiraceae bacterium]